MGYYLSEITRSGGYDFCDPLTTRNNVSVVTKRIDGPIFFKGPKRVQKGVKSGFFTKELDPLPNVMDPGGFSLDLNWTHIDLPPKKPKSCTGTPKQTLKGSNRVQKV